MLPLAGIREGETSVLISIADEMKPLLLIIFLLSGACLGATESEGLIERLPDIRLKAFADTANLRAGNTHEMVDAAVAVRDRLLPFVVTLESTLEKKSEKEALALIERDLEAISRDAHIRGNAEG